MTTLRSAAQTGRPNLARLCLLTALGFGAVSAATAALAAVRVTGEPKAVRIEAQDTSVAEILVALRSTFDLRYSSAADLTKQMTGTYVGPLQRVVARVLDGYNFVVKTTNGRVEVTVLGERKGGSVVASTPSPPSTSRTTRAPAALASATNKASPPPAQSVPLPAGMSTSTPALDSPEMQSILRPPPAPPGTMLPAAVPTLAPVPTPGLNAPLPK